MIIEIIVFISIDIGIVGDIDIISAGFIAIVGVSIVSARVVGISMTVVIVYIVRSSGAVNVQNSCWWLSLSKYLKYL